MRGTRVVVVAAVLAAVAACSNRGGGAADSPTADPLPVTTSASSTGPAPLPAAHGVAGHRHDCARFSKRDHYFLQPGRYDCIDRQPTGLISLDNDIDRGIDTELLAQQVCSIISDRRAGHILGRFLAVVVAYGNPNMPEECVYTLDVDGLTGDIQSSLVSTSTGLIKSFCIGPITGHDTRVTIAGLHGSRESTDGLADPNDGDGDIWQYRLPIPSKVTGAHCLISSLALNAQWHRKDRGLAPLSPRRWNQVALRFVAALATALKAHTD